MNAEHLLDAIGLLDDGLIREAEEYRRPQARRSYGTWLGWAASFAVVLVLGYGLTHLEMGGGNSTGNSMNGGAAGEPAFSAPAGGDILYSGDGSNGMDSDIPGLPEPDAPAESSDPEGEFRPAIMVDGVLYFSTGEPIPGEPDPSAIRTVVSYTSGTPEMDGQTNFSQDLSAQYAAVEMDGEQKLAVLMEQEWILFDTVPPRA